MDYSSNNITFTGHITWIGPLEQGISRSSGKEWRSRDFVVEERDTHYPQRILLRAKGEQVLTALEQLSRTDFPEEQRFAAHISFNARCYEKKDGSGIGYINDVSCWKLENAEGGAQ